MKERATVVAVGSRRLDYPRDCDWAKFLNQAPINLVDLSTKTTFVAKSSASERFSWIRNLIFRHFSWAIKLRSILSSIRDYETNFIFIYKNNHLLLLLCALIKSCSKSEAIIVYDSWISLSLKSKTTKQPAFISRLAMYFEQQALSRADRLITLSEKYSSYYSKTYGLDESQYIVPISAGSVWENAPKKTSISNASFAYWGNFLEQHGVDVILEAAKLLKDENLKIYIIGKGKLRAHLEQQSKAEKIDNIVFKGYLNDTELIELVDTTVACFGHLKPLHDYDLVLPNKAIQSLSRGKPIIMINDQSLEHSELRPEQIAPLLFFDGSPASLAQQIRSLAHETDALQSDLAIRNYYDTHYSKAVITSKMKLIFKK